MTLKDADKIKEAIQNSDDFVGGSYDIIRVIDSVPEVVIETDTDTISRQEAIKEVSRDIPVKSWKEVARVVELMKIFADRIKQLPPARPKLIKGRWIKKHRHYGGLRSYTGYDAMGEQHTITVDQRTEYDDLYCSECGARSADNFLNFCPNCGADMRGEQDE